MKKILLSIITTALLFGGFFILMRNEAKVNITPQQANVSVVDDRQIIEITAKGGYTPRQTVAKANLPTTIKVVTNGTYDCSAVLTIPSIKYRSFLPATGETTIDLTAQPPGSVLKGICSMGMYSFSISFN